MQESTSGAGTDTEEKFDRELETVNNKLQALTDDSDLWATHYLKNVAGEALL